GVCPVPLFEFNETEVELLSSGANLDDVRAALSRHQIAQYFFPAPDQTALGLIDRGVSDAKQVAEIVSGAPALGHPLGPSELGTMRNDLLNLVEALEHVGYVSEGEFSVTITEPGKEVRADVKYRPRESLISKLLNRMNINLDIRKLGG